jgi:hypothetical protein
MKEMIVRICAWFTMIIYSLTSVVGLIQIFAKEFTVSGVVAIIMFLVMSVTGWHARKFGRSGFKIYPFSKMTALVSLIMGLAFIMTPILLASSFGFKDSWLVIRNLLIMFCPVVVSAVAILSSNRRNQPASSTTVV